MKTSLYYILFISVFMSPSLYASELRLLALGDSYTIGESVDNTERWPIQLVNLLDKQGIISGEPIIIARTGWTSDNLLQAINNRSFVAHFDIVTVLIGVNDQFQGIPPETYATGFTAVLDKAIKLAGNRPSHVVVLSIPDYGITPFARRFNPARISQQLDVFNQHNRDISQQKNVHYIDITDISRQASTHPELLALDGLHPSGVMYQKWAQRTLPVIADIMKSN